MSSSSISYKSPNVLLVSDRCHGLSGQDPQSTMNPTSQLAVITNNTAILGEKKQVFLKKMQV